jgi:transposase
VAGCACRDRMPRYPSDLTDEQWELLEPEARAVMAELRKSPGGAPMSHDLRAMLDAIGYLTRYGIEWRALPADFPPWTAVYAFFERWSARDLPRRLADRLRGRIRIACGRAELPTAAVIDAQTVRAADTVAAARIVAGMTRGRNPRAASETSPPTAWAAAAASRWVVYNPAGSRRSMRWWSLRLSSADEVQSEFALTPPDSMPVQVSTTCPPDTIDGFAGCDAGVEA